MFTKQTAAIALLASMGYAQEYFLQEITEVIVIEPLIEDEAPVMLDEEVAEWAQVFDMVDGFLIGALDIEHVYDVEVCVRDLYPLKQDMQKIFDAFSAADFASIFIGVQAIGDFIDDLYSDIDECEAVSQTDKDNLSQMADLFTNPKQLFMDIGYNLLINGIDIWHLVQAGMEDKENGWYEQSGEAFGQAASLLFWGGEEQLLSIY